MWRGLPLAYFNRGDLVSDRAEQPLWDRVIDATDNAKKKGALFSMDNAPRVMQDGPIKVSNLLNVPILHRGHLAASYLQIMR